MVSQSRDAANSHSPAALWKLRLSRRPGAAGRSAGAGGRVCSRSAPRWRSVCRNGPAPAPPGSAHAATRSWPAAASWRIRLRPRRPARLHGPPQVFRAGPHLLDPPGYRVLVPLHRASGRDLARPAVTQQEFPNALNRVGQVETPPDHRLHATKGPAWSSQPCAAGPLGSSASS